MFINGCHWLQIITVIEEISIIIFFWYIGCQRCRVLHCNATRGE